MKTLEIQTPSGNVTLTYSEIGQEWDFFSGSDLALKEIDRMCEEMGYKYEPKKKNRMADFVAENADQFGDVIGQEKTTDQLWSDDNAELEIIENVTEAERTDIEIAFKTRNQAKWEMPVEKYGYGCRNIDEVLTHIRFGEINECNPNAFRVRLSHEKTKTV